jgi:hypothetical protein
VCRGTRADMASLHLTRVLRAASLEVEVARTVRPVAVPLLASSARCRALCATLRARARQADRVRRGPRAPSALPASPARPDDRLGPDRT